METLSIAVLIDVAYPFTRGGAEKRVALLGEEMARRGHEVTVYTLHWWPGPKVQERAGVRYVAVGPSQALYARGRRSLLQPAMFALRAFQGMRGRRHDVVDCNQFPCLHLPAAHLRSLARRESVVITWHEIWRRYWFRYAPWSAGLLGSAIEDTMPRVVDGNIAVSEHTALALRRMGVRADRVKVVPNAIDRAWIASIQPHEERTDIVFVGRLLDHKRLDRVLGTAARLRARRPGLRWTVVGSGPDERRLRSLSTGLGLRDTVRFVGAIEDDELIARCKSARLFVSASEREGFGIAALEAMACGLPVITVQAPMNAVADELVLDGHNGLVAAPPTARALAEAIDGALADEDALRRMGANALATAARFDREAVGVRLEAAYRAAMPRTMTSAAQRERSLLEARKW